MKRLVIVFLALLLPVGLTIVLEATPSTAAIEQLKQIKELRDLDILTEEEYQAKRNALLKQLDMQIVEEKMEPEAIQPDNIMEPEEKLVGPEVTITEIPEQGIWEGRWYVGGGLHYSIENFRNKLGDYNLDDTWGINVNIGYIALDYLAFDLRFQYHNQFKAKESGTTSHLYVSGTGEFSMQQGNYDHTVTLRAYDFTLNIKGRYPMDNIVPYAVVGTGILHGKVKEEYSFNPYSWFAAPFYETYSESMSDMCMRFGAGGDFLFSDNFGINFEIAYNIGYGSVSNIRFTTANIGVVHIF